ncbi:MAG: NifU family protein [bacterium]|nr:NifU family protein [bacterium]
MLDRIEAVLELARPALARHGGNIELIEYNEEEKTVYVRFLGGCKGCPLSRMTLKMGIEGLMREHIPQIHSVEAVT